MQSGSLKIRKKPNQFLIIFKNMEFKKKNDQYRYVPSNYYMINMSYQQSVNVRKKKMLIPPSIKEINQLSNELFSQFNNFARSKQVLFNFSRDGSLFVRIVRLTVRLVPNVSADAEQLQVPLVVGKKGEWPKV